MHMSVSQAIERHRYCIINSTNMNNRTKVKKLPEYKINLTQDQKNLIELAFDKQVPPEDATFIEKVKVESKNGGDSFDKLSQYFTAKYGMEFGIMYLSAIMGGKEKYKETVDSIERLKALDRIEKNKKY